MFSVGPNHLVVPDQEVIDERFFELVLDELSDILREIGLILEEKEHVQLMTHVLVVLFVLLFERLHIPLSEKLPFFEAGFGIG